MKRSLFSRPSWLPGPCLAGLLLAAAVQAQDYALRLDGSTTVATPLTGADLALPHLTIEYWFRGSDISSAVRVQEGNLGWIIAGYGPPTAPVHWINWPGSQANWQIPIDPKVNDGKWHHVALTWRSNAPNASIITGYLDGVATAVNTRIQGPAPLIAADVFIGSYNGIAPFFTNGQIDELRIWSTARTAAQLQDSYQSRPAFTGAEAGLMAYYNFNEASGTEVVNLAGGAPGIIRGADNVARNGRVLAQDESAGLWVGTVSLNRVTDPKGALTDSGGTFEFRILFHVNLTGTTVKLLKDAIVMQRDQDNNPVTPPEIVIVTDPSKIPNYRGILRRTDGRSTGLRYAASAYDFAGFALTTEGEIAPEKTLEYTLSTPESSPSNPFRHKFHPDHAKGRAYSRVVTVNFKGATAADTASGTRRITGTYKEIIKNLVKYEIQMSGTVTLDRISTSPTLNP